MVSLIAFITLNKMIFAVAAKVFLNFLFFKFTYLDCNNSVSRLFLVSFRFFYLKFIPKFLNSK